MRVSRGRCRSPREPSCVFAGLWVGSTAWLWFSVALGLLGDLREVSARLGKGRLELHGL